VLAMFDQCKLAVSNSVDLTSNQPLNGENGVSTHLGRQESVASPGISHPSARSCARCRLKSMQLKPSRTAR
jgi:hypothetical protein